MKKSLLVLFLTAVFFFICLPICACGPSSGALPDHSLDAAFQTNSEAPDEFTVLTIGTADSGGTMYPVGDAIARTLNGHDSSLKVNLSASNGSYHNVVNILDGQIDMGLVSGDMAFCAYFGSGEFEGRPDQRLCTIGAVYSSLSNWMAPDSGGLTFVHDIAGRTAAVGPQGSTTEVAARTALEAAGVTDSNASLLNYGLGSGARAVTQGELDAVHGFAGIPISGLTKLAQSVPCHLLTYTKKELSEIISSNPFYYSAVSPADTFPGQTEDVPTFGVKCLLCVNAGMDPELVYNITRILNESAQELAARHDALSSLTQKGYICDGLPIPLHPGAEAYYREAGLLDP